MISWAVIIGLAIPVFVVGQIAGVWSGVTKLTEQKLGDRLDWPLDCVPLWLTPMTLLVLTLLDLVGTVGLFGLTWYLKSFWAAVAFTICFMVTANFTCRRLFAWWCRQHPKQVARAEKMRHMTDFFDELHNEKS
jgi:hypothetical protein